MSLPCALGIWQGVPEVTELFLASLPNVAMYGSVGALS